MSIWDKVTGAIFEENPKSGASTTQAAQPNAPRAMSFPAAQQNDEYVQALQQTLKNRPTAYTALLIAADKLKSIIPDATTRFKAAFATVSGEGRGVKEIMGSLEVHAADLESQRMQFSNALKQTQQTATGELQRELDKLDPDSTNARSRIESLQREIGDLNNRISQNTVRQGELQNQLSSENMRFTQSQQQFDAALATVRAELETQKAVIQSALS